MRCHGDNNHDIHTMYILTYGDFMYHLRYATPQMCGQSGEGVGGGGEAQQPLGLGKEQGECGLKVQLPNDREQTHRRLKLHWRVHLDCLTQYLLLFGFLLPCHDL